MSPKVADPQEAPEAEQEDDVAENEERNEDVTAPIDTVSLLPSEFNANSDELKELIPNLKAEKLRKKKK